MYHYPKHGFKPLTFRSPFRNLHVTGITNVNINIQT